MQYTRFLSACLSALLSIALTQCAYANLGSEAGHTEVDPLTPALLGVEINATRTLIGMLESKVTVLRQLLAIESENTTESKPETRSRPPTRSPMGHEVFEDWLTPQPAWQLYDQTADEKATVPSIHVEMISFKASGYAATRRSSQARNSVVSDPATPLLQYLIVLDKRTGFLNVLHPVTKETIWQQRLVLPSPVVSLHFHSDRASHIVLLTEGGELLVYKIRVFYGRRLVAGDFRRSTGRESARCSYVVDQSRSRTNSAQADVRWWVETPPFSAASLPSGGFHYHVEVEFLCTTQPQSSPKVVSAVALQQNLVLIAASHDGSLTFIDGRNGSTLAQVSTPYGGDIIQFQPLSFGLVAFAVRNKIHFIDVVEKRVLDLVCVGSRHTITSITRDAWRQSVLFASTTDGSALAFQIRRFSAIKFSPSHQSHAEALDDDDPVEPSCTITSLLQSRARVFDIAVKHPRHTPLIAALPGYVVLCTDSGRLALFETASSPPGSPTYLAEIPAAIPRNAFSASLLSIDAVRDFVAGAPLAMAVSSYDQATRRLTAELFVARAPPPSSNFDIGWARAPMMLLCGVGVMFWQQKRYRPSSTSSEFNLASSRDLMRFAAEPANHRARRSY